MAALSNDKVTVIWVEGNADRSGFFRVRNFNAAATSSAADTWDASTYFAGSVEVGTFITGVSTAIGVIVSTTAAVLSFVLTGGTTGASGFLVVRGQASTGYLAGS